MNILQPEPTGGNNPYMAPTTLETLAAPVAAEQSFQSIARRVFLAWEKLRIVYVAILGLLTLLFATLPGFFSPRNLLLILEGAIGANVLYLAGPAIETYVRWLGCNQMWPRWFMFIGGTLLSMILVVGFLGGNLLPNQH